MAREEKILLPPHRRIKSEMICGPPTVIGESARSDKTRSPGFANLSSGQGITKRSRYAAALASAARMPVRTPIRSIWLATSSTRCGSTTKTGNPRDLSLATWAAGFPALPSQDQIGLQGGHTASRSIRRHRQRGGWPLHPPGSR